MELDANLCLTGNQTEAAGKSRFVQQESPQLTPRAHAETFYKVSVSYANKKTSLVFHSVSLEKRSDITSQTRPQHSK